MMHRTIAFMIIWAYLACGLWLPLGIANVDWGLYLFPPGYFFVLGAFIGLVGEWLSHRWGRHWVVFPLLALSYELGIALYGGHAAGLSLSAIFAFSTLCGYFLAPWLARFTKLMRVGAVVGGILSVAWLIAPLASSHYPSGARVSPRGEYVAWVSTNDRGDIRTVRIGPRHGLLGAFGGRVASIYEGWFMEEAPATITDFLWTENNAILVFTDNSGYLRTEEPSVLLPISATRTIDKEYQNQ